MKHVVIFVFVGLLALATHWSFLPAHSAESIPGQADGALHRAFTLFLPVITQSGASSPIVVPTLTPTLISTAPTAAATLPPTPTATAPLATPTVAATATSTMTPVATPTPSATATPTQTPTATITATNTPTSTATPTATIMPTATTMPTATSIAFPDITLSCVAEPTINDARLLKITVQTTGPAPSAVSFKFVPTQLTGPVDEILRPGPTTFQLVNIFSNQSAATSTGWLARCDTANSCTATYTLTETTVTRYIGSMVDCQF